MEHIPAFLHGILSGLAMFKHAFRKYLKICRFGIAWLVPLGGYAFGIVMAMRPPIPFTKILYGLLSITSGTALGYAVNFYVDQKVDALATEVKDMKNPFVTGEAMKRELFPVVTAALPISLIFAYLTSHLFFTYTLLCAFFSIFCYSILQFKGQPILDLISFPVTAFSLTFLSGYTLFTREIPKGLLIGGASASTIAHLVTEEFDIEFDRKAGLKTTAVWLNEKTVYFKLLLFMIAIFSGLLVDKEIRERVGWLCIVTLSYAGLKFKLRTMVKFSTLVVITFCIFFLYYYLAYFTNH